MGMTIDEYIKRMGDIRSNYDRWSGLGLTPNEAKAFDFAIETMSKYQKIREIAFPLQFCSTDKLEHEAIMKICEVLEDGKID